jgi:SH3-like domain-containing protein
VTTAHWRWMWPAALGVALASAVITGAAADSNRFVRVKVEVANIRSGPGTAHDLLWSVEQNYTLRVVGRQRQWLKTVDFIGDEGWVYAPLTDRAPAVVVRADLANARAGPGTRYAIRYVAEWGTGFRVVGRKGRWLRVEHAGEGPGWIHANLVWGAKG